MRPRRHARGSSGQGTLEFALTAIAFLFLAFGLIEFARIYYAYNAVHHAAREAVRFAVTGLVPAPGDPPFASEPNNIVGRKAGIFNTVHDQLMGIDPDTHNWTVTYTSYPYSAASGTIDYNNPVADSLGNALDAVQVQIKYQLPIVFLRFLKVTAFGDGCGGLSSTVPIVASETMQNEPYTLAAPTPS
jgi:Flp pilus assembly protein TadG